MSEEKKSNHKGIYGIIGVVCIVIAIVLVVVWVLSDRHETRSSENKNEEEMTSMDCTTNELGENAEPFFDYGEPVATSHELKTVFRNDKLDVLTYKYDGTYDSEKLAEERMSKMHAQYNYYMSDHGLDQTLANPNFSRNKEVVDVTLYLEKDKLNHSTAELFFITDDEFANAKDFSSKTMEKLYEAKGFSCTIHN